MKLLSPQRLISYACLSVSVCVLLCSGRVNKPHLLAVRETNSMVEEFMLLANISVAQRIYDEFPDCAMLRKHPAPPPSNYDILLKAAKSKVSRDQRSCRNNSHRLVFQLYVMSGGCYSVIGSSIASGKIWAESHINHFRTLNRFQQFVLVCRVSSQDLKCCKQTSCYTAEQYKINHRSSNHKFFPVFLAAIYFHL